jgi:hypothetical protein
MRDLIVKKCGTKKREKIKNKKKKSNKKPLLFSGQVVDGNKILDSNAPLKTGDVIDWNQFDYM